MSTSKPPLLGRNALRWTALSVLLLAFILLPYALWEEPLAAFSERIIEREESRGMLFLMVVLLLGADVVLPIPSSFVAAFAVSVLGGVLGGLAVWVGLQVAVLFGYALGRFGGMPLARSIAGATQLERAAQAMQRRDAWVLLLCRGLPVFAEASTLFAGAVGHSFPRFLLLVTLGNAGLSLAYATLSWFRLSGVFEVLVPFGFGVLIPAIALWLLHLVGNEPRAGRKQLRNASAPRKPSA